eukprot:jgi/Tetstr1/462530/TSEL_007519.t1
MSSKAWLERIDREMVAAKQFWKKEGKLLQEKAARLQDGQSSIGTSTFINSDTTISTMVIRDKLKRIENEIAFEKNKRSFLENQLNVIQESTMRSGSKPCTPVTRIATPLTRTATPVSHVTPKPSTVPGGQK